MVDPTNLSYDNILSILNKIGKSEHFDKIIQSYRTIIKKNHIYSLDLIGLRIQKLPAGIFDEFKNLTHLYLAWNNLKELPPNIFNKLGNLVHLDLRGSGLSIVHEVLFNNLKRLQRLELNDNNLVNLPDHVFDNLISLRELNLSNNKIKSLHPPIFDNLANLEHLYLYFNPLPEEISFGNYYDRETVIEVLDLLKTTFSKI
ncbi:MAG: hypothetical protein HeimC2_12970 [Candidatus Heimdallarchaeota archaeon LC_2]|nr:MAG: hypothetical protein HeimC2_12970 [Candidatus Heimdallarchaeota archaeon LC_2]